MDKRVLDAMAKWPNVPALYGWLRLDRRGRWHLRGQVVERRSIVDFIGRNYEADERGCWFFQNGPQRAFVELDYTPWVLRAQPDGGLLTHARVPVERLHGAYLDDSGSLLLSFDGGVGLLDDNDLSWALDRLQDAEGHAPDEAELVERLEKLQRGEDVRLMLRHDGHSVALRPIRAVDVPEHFGFVRQPKAADD